MKSTGVFAQVSVSGFSKPALLDIDLDGDQDLVIGDDLGGLTFYRNAGSVLNPSFVKIADSTNPFTVVGGRAFATPAFALLDGALSLVVGSAPGQLDFAAVRSSHRWSGR